MSSASNKKLLELVEKMYSEIKDLKQIVKTHGTSINMINENVKFIHVKVSDLSCKVDFDISTLNITSSKATTKSLKNNASTDSDKKPKLNIMSYFKGKYKLSIQVPGFVDPVTKVQYTKENIDAANAVISQIVTKAEINKLFENYTDEIKAKSKKKDTLETFKASLIYKELIKENTNKVAMLRSLKDSEESDNTVINPEIVENIIEMDDDTPDDAPDDIIDFDDDNIDVGDTLDNSESDDE